MNACRLCQKEIPARLCFCTRCTQTRLTPKERFEVMAPRLVAEHERIAKAIVARINGERSSVPPGAPETARAAFQKAREILKPVIGKEPRR